MEFKTERPENVGDYSKGNPLMKKHFLNEEKLQEILWDLNTTGINDLITNI